MRSITNKIKTLRTARAQATVRMSSATVERVRNNDLPKADVLPIARAAGIMAVKKTWEILPYCHPIPIDWVEVKFDVKEDSIVIEVTAEAVAKTGVEMEALTGASVTALTLYDMLKPIDEDLEILGVKLLEKKGGKSSFVEKIPKGFRAAVLVSSDSTAKGTRQDKSGKIICERLLGLGIEVEYQIVPDDEVLIEATLQNFCEQKINLVLTTGGTGLGPRDVTVEATEKVIERIIPGIMEAARAHGQNRTPYAMLSRGLAGQKGNTIIVNLPGSSKGVEESLDAIFPSILHAYKMMRGASHELTA